MWASIISAIVAIAGTAISANINSNQQKKAQNEARALAARNRADTMKQQVFQNRQNRRSLQLAEDQLTQSNKMDEISMRNQEAEAQKQIDTTNQSFINKSAQNTLGIKPQEESFLYKRNLLSRIS